MNNCNLINCPECATNAHRNKLAPVMDRVTPILRYKNENGLTWLGLAQRFGAKHYQEAQDWNNQGWYIITHKGEEKLVSTRRKRVQND